MSWTGFQNDDKYKIVPILGFIFIIISLLIIIISGPVTSYEFSIYDSYPWYFWFFVVLSVLCGLLILFMHIINKQKDNSFYYGLLMILLSNFIVLCLPLIRGYYIYGSGDVLTHVGYVKEITGTGYFNPIDLYPIDHIISTILFYFSGISIETSTMIIPSVFCTGYIIFLFVLGKTLFKDIDKVLMLILVGTCFWFVGSSNLFAPNNQGFIVIPVFFYAMIKSRFFAQNIQFTIITLIIGFFMVFFHPIIGISAIVLLLFFEMSLFIYNYITNKREDIRRTHLIALCIGMAFISWTSYLVLFVRSASSVSDYVFGKVLVASPIQAQMEIVTYVQPSLYDLIRHFVTNTLSGILVYLLVFYSIFLILYYHIIKKNKAINLDLIITLIGYLIMFCIFLMTLFVNIFGVGRLTALISLFTLLLISIGLTTEISSWNNFDLNQRRFLTIKKGIIFFVLLFVLLSSLFHIYYSPISYTPNQQVAKSDFIGMQTFFQYRDLSKDNRELGIIPYRYFDAIYGVVHPDHPPVQEIIPINHLGYDRQRSIKDVYPYSLYFFLDNQGKYFYQNIYPQFPKRWKFTPADFNRLEYDNGIQKIYTNDNLEIYLINSGNYQQSAPKMI